MNTYEIITKEMTLAQAEAALIRNRWTVTEEYRNSRLQYGAEYADHMVTSFALNRSPKPYMTFAIEIEDYQSIDLNLGELFAGI